ncbi:MAG: hypothetical protein ABSF53_21195 [Terracidiphilus sp.]
MKKLAATIFLVWAGLTMAYNWLHVPAGSSFSESALAVVAASGQAQAISGTATSVQWMTVRDVHEQAFSIQVPRGWKTYGGLFRYSRIDSRLVVDMTSPDGLTNLRVGDATVPPYRVPGPYAHPGPGVAAYVAGNVFASKYGQARFASMCQGLRLTKADAMTPKYHPAQQGISRTTAGQAFFTCTRNGAPMNAYVYAETMLMGPGGPGSSWVVVALGSVIAPTAQATAAGAMLQHAGSSLAMNPAWTQMQDQLNQQAIQQINASTRATIAATNAENAREQSMIRSLNNDSFNDVINGVQATVDTSTGQRYIVPLGTGGTQWVNGDRTVVESGLSPGAGFDRLTPTRP